MNGGPTRPGLRAFLSRARAGSLTLRLRGRALIATAPEARAGAASAAQPITEGPEAGTASAAELTALRGELALELERLAAEPPRQSSPRDAPGATPSPSRHQLR